MRERGGVYESVRACVRVCVCVRERERAERAERMRSEACRDREASGQRALSAFAL